MSFARQRPTNSMQITREELNPCTVKLTVVCENPVVREGFERAYKDLAKRVRVPGFRPGQAPKAMIEKLISKEAVYDAAAENIVRHAYRQAIQQEHLEPYSQPSVQLKTLDEETGICEFEARVPLAPRVELADYRGLPAERPLVEVRDEEIDRQLEDLRRKRSSRVAITDRGVLEGDVAVISIQPEESEGGGRTFMTIAGQTFPELDSALLGMRVEEIKSAELTFPEGFQEGDWAGKKLRCRITLRSLSAVSLPELNEEFAKLYNSENVGELRERIRKAIESAKEAMVEEHVNEQLLDVLLRQSTIHVPDTMWEQVAERRIRELADEQAKRGGTLEKYAAEQGMTLEKLLDLMRSEAKTYVKRAVAIQEIYKQEKLKVDNADLQRELLLMAREFGIEPEDLLGQLRKNQALDELHFRAMNRKVVDFLRGQANLTDVRED